MARILKVAVKSPAGGGKDWLFQQLQAEQKARSVGSASRPWRRIAFADPIYKMAAIMTGLPVEQVEAIKEGRPISESIRNVLPPELRDLSDQELSNKIRRCLQFAGTELGRVQWASENWIHLLLRETGSWNADEIGGVFVTDLRFRNEFDALRKEGFLLVYLDAPVEFHRIQPDDPKYNHPSERDLDEYRAQGKFDLELLNDRRTPAETLLQSLYQALESLSPRVVDPVAPTSVFVYGSLRRGFHNHGYLKNANFVAHVTLPGFELHRLCASYPTAVRTDRNDDVVQAECYEIDQETLATLDRLEGHPNSRLFRRELATSTCGKTGWVYCCSDPEEIDWIQNKRCRIESGEWNSCTSYPQPRKN